MDRRTYSINQNKMRQKKWHLMLSFCISINHKDVPYFHTIKNVTQEPCYFFTIIVRVGLWSMVLDIATIKDKANCLQLTVNEVRPTTDD